MRIVLNRNLEALLRISKHKVVVGEMRKKVASLLCLALLLPFTLMFDLTVAPLLVCLRPYIVLSELQAPSAAQLMATMAAMSSNDIVFFALYFIVTCCFSITSLVGAYFSHTAKVRRIFDCCKSAGQKGRKKWFDRVY